MTEGGVTTRLRRMNGSLLARRGWVSLLIAGPLLIAFAASEASAQAEVDLTFAPSLDATVVRTLVQPDGRILIAFGSAPNGIPTDRKLLRFFPDGTEDPSFKAYIHGGVRALALQPDGRIVIGGQFVALGPSTVTDAQNPAHQKVGRLHPDGSLDRTFNGGANGDVLHVDVLPDGRIFVGGEFTVLGPGLNFPFLDPANTSPRVNIGLLEADGAVAATFSPVANGPVVAVARQPDGKVLIGGRFTAVTGSGSSTSTQRYGVARLLPDGRVDTGFNPGANNGIDAFAVQPDGRIVVVGQFTTIGGGGTGTTARSKIARLMSDGTFDASFSAFTFDQFPPSVLLLQTDGRILFGGPFASINNVPRHKLVRVLADGSIDPTFAVEAGYFTFNTLRPASVSHLGLQPDGRILVAGAFDDIGVRPNWVARSNFARLLPGSLSGGPPGAPADLAVAGQGNALRISWAAPTSGSPVSSYTLLARRVCAGSLLAALDVGAVRTYDVPVPDGTYCLSVRAANAFGQSPESPALSVTVPRLPAPPGPPAALAALVAGTSVQFSWSAPSSGGTPTGYRLVASLATGGPPLAILPMPATSTRAAFSGVPPGSYSVFVDAFNGGGASGPSNGVVATIVSDLPGAPAMLPPSVSGRVVTLSWAPGAGGVPDSYLLNARLAASGPVIAALPLTGTSLSVAAPAGTYHLTVLARNVSGSSQESNSVVVVVP